MDLQVAQETCSYNRDGFIAHDQNIHWDKLNGLFIIYKSLKQFSRFQTLPVNINFQKQNSHIYLRNNSIQNNNECDTSINKSTNFNY